ncbi:MAG: DUF2851 family protein [Bacteroidales bacterium]|nr:DUF2851 family protein [Bacteroidales bacterium]
MTEDFLYYIWQYRLMKHDIETTTDESIIIIDTGQQNDGSGPDFFNARLKIGNTEWAGNVEMHSKASDWMRHKHDVDPNYDSVILHVVYDCDMMINNATDEEIPCLELKGKIDEKLYFRYKNLIASREWIACAQQLNEIPDLILFSWLDRLLAERLERKTDYIEAFLQSSNGNWEMAFYYALARNFGFNVNSEPFEQLARSIPLDVLAKNRDSLFKIEALLFGQSGMLNERLKDEYSQKLIAEYEFLRKKYQLEPIAGYQWKFMRLRPGNFPSIRIAQFAQLIFKSTHLLSKIVKTEKLSQLKDFFQLEASDYWNEHYSFGKKSKNRKKRMGESSFDLILINTLVPFLFVYANHQKDDELRERALFFLSQTKAEQNSIVKRYRETGITATNAAQSQALLTLKNDYCKYLKCLDCAIGNRLIRK